jgi:hypothetical protein
MADQARLRPSGDQLGLQAVGSATPDAMGIGFEPSVATTMSWRSSPLVADDQ